MVRNYIYLSASVPMYFLISKCCIDLERVQILIVFLGADEVAHDGQAKQLWYTGWN